LTFMWYVYYIIYILVNGKNEKNATFAFVTKSGKSPPSLTHYFKDNIHVSFFVGVSANDAHPESIQGGDRNLCDGPETFRDYGFSPKSGKGNDTAIQTNSLDKPVSWSMKMHSAGNVAGAGIILLGDGSARLVSSAGFRKDWLSHAAPTTNWPTGHTPVSPSIRLVFP